MCKGAKADLVFLIDGSWSIGDESFAKVRQFVFSMIGAFDVISYEGMQVTDLSEVMWLSACARLWFIRCFLSFCENRCLLCSTAMMLKLSSNWTPTTTREWFCPPFRWSITEEETLKQVCDRLSTFTYITNTLITPQNQLIELTSCLFLHANQ